MDDQITEAVERDMREAAFQWGWECRVDWGFKAPPNHPELAEAYEAGWQTAHDYETERGR